MKVLSFNKELCIGCHTCEETCSKTYYKTEDILKARLKIIERVDDFNLFMSCNQCGDCVNECPEGAIYKTKNGVININKDLCVGCMMCVAFCSEFYYHNDYVEPFKCISCGACAKSCPTNALTMIEVEV